MNSGPELFPIAIGQYEHFEDIEVEREVAAIESVLSGFDCHTVDWDVAMPERGADAVDARLAAWSKSTNPQAILYWVGHGWSDDERAALAHRNSPATVKYSGVTPERVADAIARRRSEHEDSWVLVIIDACRSARFVQLVKSKLAHRGALLMVGGMSGEGATNLGKVSESLRFILHTTCAADYEIPLRDLALHLEKLGAEVEQKRLLDLVLHRRHAVVVNIPLDVRDELDAALNTLTSDELRHFLPRAHGGELPFKETMLGEQSWYFEGRQTETEQIVSWLRTRSTGMLVVTGPAGCGKSALLGHLVVQANPTLRTALQRAQLLTALPAAQQPPDAVFDVVLHLTGASTGEVVARLAEGIGIDHVLSPDIETAMRWLTSRFEDQAPVTILVDALDEAVDPIAVARDVLKPLATIGSVRIIVGTRPSTREQPDSPATDADILNDLAIDTVLRIERHAESIRRYVQRRLRTARRLGAVDESMDIDGFADALHRRDRHFLFAHLVVHEVLADPRRRSEAEWGSLLDRDHRQVFGLAVERLSAANPVNRSLLLGLAHARGRGVPVADGLWTTISRSSAEESSISPTDIDRLLADAAPYVLADREYGQTVYRLAHRTFTEYFGTGDQDTHLHIARSLIAFAEAGLDAAMTGERPLNPYLTQLLTTHIAAAGEPGWRLLAGHERILPILDPEQLTNDAFHSALGRFPLPPVIRGIVAIAEHLRRIPPHERVLAIQLATAHQTGSHRPALADTPADAPIIVQAAVLRAHTTQRILDGHSNGVNSLAVVELPDGTHLLASAGVDATIRLWDPADGRPHGAPLIGHAGAVRALVTIPTSGGGSLLVSAGTDHTVRIWDPSTGAPIGDHPYHSYSEIRVLTAVPWPDGRVLLALGTHDYTLRLWDPITQQPFGEPRVSMRRSVRGLAAVPLPDGTVRIASIHDGHRVRLWDPISRRDDDAQVHDHRVLAVATVRLANGRVLLASGGADEAIRIWDPVAGHDVGAPLTGNDGWIRVLTAVPVSDRVTLLAAAADRSIRLWDPLTGQQHGGPLTGHTGRITALAAVPMPDGRTLLASSSTDETIRLWDPFTGHSKTTDRAGEIPIVQALTAVPMSDGRVHIAAGGDDGAVQLRDPISGQTFGASFARKAGRAVRALAAAAMPSGTTLIGCAQESGDILIRDAATGAAYRIPTIEKSAGARALVTIEVPGSIPLMAYGGDHSRIWVWNPATGDSRSLNGRILGVSALAAVPASGGLPLLASASIDRRVRLWDPTTGERVGPTITSGTAQINALAAVPLPDGRTLLAAAGDRGAIEVWDVSTGNPHDVLPIRHTHEIRSLATVTLADGTALLASAGTSGFIRLWDPVIGTSPGPFPERVYVGAPVNCLCAIGDILIVGLDGLVMLRLESMRQ